MPGPNGGNAFARLSASQGKTQMRYQTWGLSALMLLLVPFSAPRATNAPLETIEEISALAVEGDAYINADGSLADYRIDTHAPGDTAANVVRIARGWHFEPVVVDGKAQAVVARMRVALAATKLGESYQVRVDNVTFPGLVEQARERFKAQGTEVRLAEDVTRPVYPHGLQQTGITGRVLVALRYDDSGKVTDVAAVQSMLFDRRESENVTTKAISMFEGSALAAARHWRIRNATAAPFRIVLTNIDFVMDRQEKNGSDGAPAQPGHWRLVSRTPRRHVEWMDTGRAGMPSVSDVAGGGLVPVAEATLKLREPVIGTVL